IQDYGYYRVDLLSEAASQIYPDDALIEYGDYLASEKAARRKRYLSIVNTQQQCLEAEALKRVVDESTDASLNYFGSKQNVMKVDLKALAKKSGTRQFSSLEHFL
ncbi:MAG: hypothetical protein GX885_04490, partial [Methanomicrobiales archaeon]|nr:hypothetical protein [Methanomicrobiales archaeon]